MGSRQSGALEFLFERFLFLISLYHFPIVTDAYCYILLLMYIFYALAGAVAASLGTIFAKFGLKGVDSNLLTSLRGVVMAVIVTVAALLLGRLDQAAMSSLTAKQWMYIILSGAGGALSWLFFYYALANGPTVSVTVIDKLSIVLTAVLAVVVLGEGITMRAVIGLVLVVAGTLLVAIK
jgi:transporter family protein